MPVFRSYPGGRPTCCLPRSWIVVLGCISTAVLGPGRATAQDEPAAGPSVVAATVGDEPVYASDVERLLGKVTGRQAVNPAALPVLQAQVLSEIVDRRLVLAYARRTGSGATPAEIEAVVAELQSKLQSQQQSLGDYLRERSITETDLRRQIAWDLVWPKYLARYVTDQRLESYFESHRRQFDGTEIAVSHVLLRLPAGGGPGAIDDLVKQAEAIREEITSGKTSFAEAARRHSAGPSAAEGGRLGFIARRGAMAEAFSRAAFALEAGQVSRPVVTRFGVHLIRCDEIKPGSKQSGDVRRQLEEALAGELIEKLARLEARQSPVEFTGKAPYFKPGTRELVVP